MIKFSVLVSIYKNDNPDYLKQALESIMAQSFRPNEIVIVEDGPLTDLLYDSIDTFCKQYDIAKRVKIAKNQGLGNALNAGLRECSFEYVARMDSDDINVYERFAKQVNFFKSNTDISVLGGFIEEFVNTPGDLKRIKKVPLSPEAIKQLITKRNPLNHVSVMFKKKDIEACLSYESVLFFEDYYLWFKLNKRGFKMANLNETLLYVRIGNDMIGRRHGWEYLKKEIAFIVKAFNNSLITRKDAALMAFSRLPVRVMPKFVIKGLYRFFLR